MEGEFDRRPQPLLIHFGWEGILRDEVPHGPGLGIGRGQSGPHRNRIEVDSVVVPGMNDASLVAVETGSAPVATGEGRVNPLPVIVDDVVEVLQVRLGQFQQVHGHVSAVPSRRFLPGSGDEDRRAEELRVPGQTEVAGVLILGFLHGGTIRARGKSRPCPATKCRPMEGGRPAAMRDRGCLSVHFRSAMEAPKLM